MLTYIYILKLNNLKTLLVLKYKKGPNGWSFFKIPLQWRNHHQRVNQYVLKKSV